ncbi:MAG: archaellin/type IV pilin N-terminal domain-containing protein [Candidatus Woesearchaeota archaeon]
MITKNKQGNRMRLFNSRKAVSPLIATVLLIAFAVALGAVVMNWGRGYVEDTANIARERSDTEVRCASEVDVNIVEIDSVPQICYNSTGGPGSNYTIEFIVENKKSRTVEKLQARLIGDKTRVPLTIDMGDNSNMSTNEARFLNFSYLESVYGNPQQVQLTPYIKVGAVEVGCPSSSEIVTTVKPCSEVWV